MNDSFYEKTLSSESIYKGKIIDVSRYEVELPNGAKGMRELVHHQGAVGITAVTEENKMVMVKQFRKPLDRTLVEIPAGKLEANEDPKSCARRELEEETGYSAKKLEYVASFYTSPGFSNEIMHIYFADQLTPGEAHTDDDEFVELMELTLDEALELERRKVIYDAKTVYALQFLQLKKNLQDG